MLFNASADTTDVAHGRQALATGKAVGKEGVGVWMLVGRQLQAGGQLLPLGIRESDVGRRHIVKFKQKVDK